MTSTIEKTALTKEEKHKILIWACKKSERELEIKINNLIDQVLTGDEFAKLEAKELVNLLQKRQEAREKLQKQES